MPATRETRSANPPFRSFELRVDLTFDEFTASATDAMLNVARILREAAHHIEEDDMTVAPIRTVTGEIAGQFEFAEVPLVPLETNARLVLTTLKRAIEHLSEPTTGKVEDVRDFVVQAKDVVERAEGRGGSLSLQRWLLGNT